MTQRKATVLVVDDDESIRILLKRILENAQYEVETAVDGEDALGKAAQKHFDIALLDITMPKLSGIEVLKWLTQYRPEVCTIMITAVASLQTAVDSMKMGAYDYITKPFTPDEALAKIRSSLSRKNTELDEDQHRIELEKKVAEQTGQLQQQFSDLIATLAREHALLYQLAEKKPGGVKRLLKRLPPELQEPLSSAEDFRKALLKILSRQSPE